MVSRFQNVINVRTWKDAFRKLKHTKEHIKKDSNSSLSKHFNEYCELRPKLCSKLFNHKVLYTINKSETHNCVRYLSPMLLKGYQMVHLRNYSLISLVSIWLHILITPNFLVEKYKSLFKFKEPHWHSLLYVICQFYSLTIFFLVTEIFSVMAALMKLLVIFLYLGAATSEVDSDFSKCKNFFYQSRAPAIDLTGADESVMICQYYNGQHHFATLYSERYRIPIYSAYNLTLEKGCSQQRPSKWFMEPQVGRQIVTSFYYHISVYDS